MGGPSSERLENLAVEYGEKSERFPLELYMEEFNRAPWVKHNDGETAYYSAVVPLMEEMIMEYENGNESLEMIEKSRVIIFTGFTGLEQDGKFGTAQNACYGVMDTNRNMAMLVVTDQGYFLLYRNYEFRAPVLLSSIDVDPVASFGKLYESVASDEGIEILAGNLKPSRFTGRIFDFGEYNSRLIVSKEIFNSWFMKLNWPVEAE
ncbi:MAG: hypothetical protein QY318_00600 [Candidatus Dojkabacteria bacterium]|nr:MAG: hypothetical protein QY318_00600 [Candidatus Dojkabacteria bacterium]